MCAWHNLQHPECWLDQKEKFQCLQGKFHLIFLMVCKHERIVVTHFPFIHLWLLVSLSFLSMSFHKDGHLECCAIILFLTFRPVSKSTYVYISQVHSFLPGGKFSRSAILMPLHESRANRGLRNRCCQAS